MDVGRFAGTRTRMSNVCSKVDGSCGRKKGEPITGKWKFLLYRVRKEGKEGTGRVCHPREVLEGLGDTKTEREKWV